MNKNNEYSFDYVIFGSGAAGSLLANQLSESNKIALVDIAFKKKSKERTRYVPPYVNKFTKNYTPTNSGNFGGNTDLWAGKCYLLTPEEIQDWPINYDELLKFSKLLSKELNIDHDNICHLSKQDNNTYLHRSQRGVLGNMFECLNIEFNENITCFENLTLNNFNFDSKSKKITYITISNKKEEIKINIKKSIILCCGGLGNIPIYSHFLKCISNELIKKRDFKLKDHPHFKIGKVSSNVMPNIHKGYLNEKREKYEDCLIVFNKSINFAFQIDAKKIGSDFFLNIFRQNNNIVLKIISYNLYKLNVYLTSMILILTTFGQSRRNKSIELFMEEPQNSKSKLSISNKKWFNNQLEMININYQDPTVNHLFVRNKINKLTGNKVRNINKDSFKRKNMYAGLHPSCSTPFKKEADLGEIDINLQIKGFSNLFMSGTNVFPSNGVTNPTWTLMVLSRRLAFYLSKKNNK